MAHTTHTLVGQNYTPPDLVAKVTGQAKYAEDFRARWASACTTRSRPIREAEPWTS